MTSPKKEADNLSSTTHLINIVKKYPILYDRNTVGYFDDERKDRVWMKIAEELKVDVKLCKLNWRILRSLYFRCIKEAKRHYNHVCDKNGTVWTFFQAMCFLRKSVERAEDRQTIQDMSMTPINKQLLHDIVISSSQILLEKAKLKIESNDSEIMVDNKCPVENVDPTAHLVTTDSGGEEEADACKILNDGTTIKELKCVEGNHKEVGDFLEKDADGDDTITYTLETEMDFELCKEHEEAESKVMKVLNTNDGPCQLYVMQYAQYDNEDPPYPNHSFFENLLFDLVKLSSRGQRSFRRQIQNLLCRMIDDEQEELNLLKVLTQTDEKFKKGKISQ